MASKPTRIIQLLLNPINNHLSANTESEPVLNNVSDLITTSITCEENQS